MRLSLDVGWLHMALTLGPDEEPEPDGWRESQADALVERSGPEPDNGAELDCRPVGFRGSQSSGGRRRKSAITGRFITPRRDA